VPDEQPDIPEVPGVPEIPTSVILDPDNLDAIRVILSLERLGELIAHVAFQLAALRGLEPPDVNGEEMKALAIGGWQHCMQMADVEHFKATLERDLANLEATPPPTPPPPPPTWEHKTEFGL
jgi:hypothetical protein